MSAISLRSALLLSLLLVTSLGCENRYEFDPSEPSRGPGALIDTNGPLNSGLFSGGNDPEILAREVTPPGTGQIPDCDADCVSFCESQGFENPVHKGLCPSLWGVGLQPMEINRVEACRRLHVDVKGRFPSRTEMQSFCDDRPWGEIVSELINTEDFVLVNRQKWADHLLYNTRALSVERIFDMDHVVALLYRGEIAYDHFAAVTSAHPVLTRRHDTAGDRAEALFQHFLGRPPLGNERSDFARLYALWHNGYYDHPQLGMRLSDAYIQYRCVDSEGNVDPDTRGQCTSVLYGYNELILQPDIRARRNGDRIWSGLLKAEEWEKLQLPGRLLARQDAFWEHAVDEVIRQYLDYDLTISVPEVRDEMVKHLLRYDGDIRAVHHALLSSVVYLQSSAGDTPTDHRWTHGPVKQVHAEAWLDTINHTLELDMPRCDHRISEPGDFSRAGTIGALALLENSYWQIRDDRNDPDTAYSSLARNLGGCPVNDVNGRFRIVSILTTATQLNFVENVCNPESQADRGVDIAKLLPRDVNPDRLVTPDLAEEIIEHQVRLFYGRRASTAERADARRFGEACELEVCRASQFARPACFALLSSSEMLFY